MGTWVRRTVISIFILLLVYLVDCISLVQQWTSVLLASYGVTLLLGAREYIFNPYVFRELMQIKLRLVIFAKTFASIKQHWSAVPSP